MKLVLAHDSFTQLGGAERVFLCMADIFPEAPIYTLVLDKNIAKQLPTQILHRIRVTKLQCLYNVFPVFQYLLPLIPFALRLTKLPKCDVLFSSSSAFAKGFRKPKGARHVNYCHTPTRFLWTDSEYFAQEVPKVLRFPAKIFLRWMKTWDLRVTKNVDVFVANSKEVQARIKKYYKRDSEVIYPFVDTEFWKPLHEDKAYRGKGIVQDAVSSTTLYTLHPNPYFLIAGRLHAHKHNDLVINACNDLGLNLHVVGTGRDEAHLRAIAGPAITFLGRISDEDLKNEYRGARGYIYPQVEDFGLMPLEAAACGTASIGVSLGGSLETIIPSITGEWFSVGNKNELKGLLQNWDESKYSVEALRAHAEEFSKKKFIAQIQGVVNAEIPNA